MPSVLLDTDIGSDVDDALALAVLLGTPDVELVGVTTVYGDTLLRARLASRLIQLAHEPAPLRRAIPVVPGAESTLSGRSVWWAGHEGKAFDDLDAQPISARRDAARFLVDTAAARPGEIDLLAIGPLTNVAAALALDPAFAANLRHLYIMGGHFGSPQPAAEHNFLCDAVATRAVFTSTLPITVTGLEITTQVQLGSPELAAIASAGPLGAALEREISQWWRFHGHTWNNPHDPIAALTLLSPQHFRASDYAVEIADDGSSLMSPVGTGRVVSVIDRIDVDAVSQEIVLRITTAGLGVRPQ
jgi:purine nucleosidase